MGGTPPEVAGHSLTRLGRDPTRPHGLPRRHRALRANPLRQHRRRQTGTGTLLIQNAPPTLASVGLSPTAAVESTTFSCSPGASDDADGDGVSFLYRWERTRASVTSTISGATASALSGTDFNRDDTLRCFATPTDTTDTGAEVGSNTVTVQNTAPTTPAVRLTPTLSNVGDGPLVCGLTTASVDEDTLDSPTYSFGWQHNGNGWGGATATTSFTGDTIPTAAVLAGSYTCTAQATDGSAVSATATSNSATVQPAGTGISLDSVCGNTVNGVVCSGNCTKNTAQYTEAYCQMEGYAYADGYTEHFSGSFGPTVYYQDSSTGLPETCADVTPFNGYGATNNCTCASNTTCGTAPIYSVGDLGSLNFHANAQRGIMYQANTSDMIYNFTGYIDIPARCDIDWYVHESTSSSGPWTAVWSGTTSAEGAGQHLSGPVRYRVTSGRFYVLSFAWATSCATGASNSFNTTGSRAAGFGTQVGYSFDNSYPGYSANYVFPSFGVSSTVFYGPHEIAVGP